MMTAAYFLALSLAYLWGFFLLYVFTMGVYRAKLSGRLSWRSTPMAWALCMPFTVLAVLVDVAAQYSVAVLVFLDLPRRGERLVTRRLQRYVADGHGWRYGLAHWLCDSVLDIFDPEGNHC